MASLLRVVAVGLAVAGLAAAGWVGYWVRALLADGRKPFDLVFSFGVFPLLAVLAVGVGGAFWSAARVVRPTTPGRLGGPLRVLAAAVALAGVAALAVSAEYYWQEYTRPTPVGRRVRVGVTELIRERVRPTLDVAWMAVGVGGLLWAAARAAYPRPTPQSGGVMSVVLRLLAGLLIGVGWAGFVAAAVAGYEEYAEPARSRERAVGYVVVVTHVLLSLVVVGLGGLLWVGVRMAYGRPSAAPGGGVTRV